MNLIRQHKNLAMGKTIDGEADDFGVGRLSGASDHPDRDMSHKPMKDGARGIGKNIDRGSGLGMQACPDHGPHQCDFGVDSIPR